MEKQLEDKVGMWQARHWMHAEFDERDSEVRSLTFEVDPKIVALQKRCPMWLTAGEFSSLIRKDEFFDRLDYKITWRAEFIFDAQINKDLIKFLHTKNKKVINEADISVYDSNFNIYFEW